MAKPWYNGPWPKVRRYILERDQYQCQVRSPVCTRKATQVDHIIRISQGGAWWADTNLRAICRECNVGWNRGIRTGKPSRNW